MINFPCKCGHAYSLPDEQAGGLVQCPDCGLLADVPTLSDLANLNPDGTFAFEDPESLPDNVTAADLHRVFTNKTVDSFGVEKDLRPKAEHYEAIGLQDQIKPRAAPRYDPVTGELIRPLQLMDETATPVLVLGELVNPDEVDIEAENAPLRVISVPSGTIVPGASRPGALNYAKGETARQVNFASLALELLMPANAIVMFFVFLLYIVAYFTTEGLTVYSERMFAQVWQFVFFNVWIYVLLAHIGTVIEESGPNQMDELPRPLRDFSLGEDLISPLFRTLIAAVLCFFPTAFAALSLSLDNSLRIPILLVLGSIGAYLFPACVLTTVAGTTVLNLTPMRVLEVIRLCGLQYFLSVILLIAAVVPTAYYLAAPLILHRQLPSTFVQYAESTTVMLPVMMVAIYFLHFFCCHLGLMYRVNHDEFPWLAQRHVKDKQAVLRL